MRAMLKGDTQPGVWFPEQREAVPDRRALLQARTAPRGFLVQWTLHPCVVQGSPG